jgi:hypothetical protein
VVAPRGADWWQFLRPRGPLTLSDLPFILLDLAVAAPFTVLLPAWGLASSMTAPDVAVMRSGLRLVPLPIWPQKDVPWEDISRFVVREPRRSRRRDPVIHYVYLRDGSYFPIFNRAMANWQPLVQAMAAHVTLEHI